MRIDSGFNNPINNMLKVQEQAKDIVQIANSITNDSTSSINPVDALSTMIEQVPEIISYSALEKSIEIQEVAMQRLLDIRA